MRLLAIALITSMLTVPVASAQLQNYVGPAGGDFNDGSNWSDGLTPTGSNLNVVGAGGEVTISSNAFSDSLRSFDTGIINQTGGTLTIENGLATDNGLWVGEGGVGAVYNLSGGMIQINDDLDNGGAEDSFFIGRNGGSSATFNQTGGDIFVGRNNGTEQRGIMHVGLDGSAFYNHSSGSLNALAVQVGRFASPFAEANLSGDADWNIDGLVLVADGSANIGSAMAATLGLSGSNVEFNAAGLILRQKSILEFTADSNGISTVNLGSGPNFISDGATLNINLSAYSGTDDLVLVDASSAFGGLGTFSNFAEGDIVAPGYTITYTGGADGFDIILQSSTAIPEPAASLVCLGFALICVRRRRR